ncbi:MAG: Ig-like domain-containing protein [Gaiellales bacterium]
MRRAPATHLSSVAAALALLGAGLALAGPALAAGRGAPTIRLTGHPAAHVQGKTTTVRFHVTGRRIVVTCVVDGHRARRCTSPLRLRGLAVGSHRLQVRATNRFGRATVTARWKIARSFVPIRRLPPAIAVPPTVAPAVPVLPYTPPVYSPPVLPTAPIVAPVGFHAPTPPAPRPPSSPDTGAGPALSVALTSPTAGDVLTGFATLTATASAETGRVAWVDFLVDGNVIGSDTTAPYSFRLPAAELGAGSHTFAALAVDTSFDRVTSAPVVATAGTTVYTRDVSTASAFVQAVHDLASSGGSIHLEPGTYQLGSALEIGSNIDIVGSGAGLTTIQATSGTTSDLLRFDNVHDTSLRDATIDYNGGTQSAIYVNLACYDNLFQRLSVIGLSASRFGIQSWQQPGHDFSVQDSALDGSSDGVTPGGSTGIAAYGADPATSDDSAFRNIVRNFKDYGIEFADHINGVDLPGERSVAVENTVTNISNPATANGQNEAGIWLGGQDGIAYRNVVTQTGWELIWTGTNCYRCLVRENALGLATYGVYLEHSSDGTTVEGNSIANVSFGVNIEWSYFEGTVYRGTTNAVIRGNTITTLNGTGIEGSVSDDGLIVDGNTIRGSRTPVALQALQHATVENNDLRDPAATYCVYEWGIDPDESTTIRASDFNTITGNDCRGVTKGVVYHLNASDGVNDTVSGNLWP